MSKKQVLVTRPEHLAGPLCEAIVARGWSPVRFPCLAIEWQNCPALGDYEILIFISINAVLGADLESLNDQQTLIAMGPGTQRVLAQRGFDANTPDQPYTSEILLAMDALQNLRGKRVAVVAGKGGREVLVDALQGQGADARKIEVYQRSMPDSDSHCLHDFWIEPDRVILVTSLQTLDNLVTLVPETNHSQLFSTTLIVPSQRIKDTDVCKRFSNVVLAKSVSVDHLLESVSS